MTEFDPTQHRMVPQQRWFEDFALGERFVHSQPHHDISRLRRVSDRERR